MKKVEVQIFNLNEEDWINYLELFDDASIYQTNAFAKYSIGGKNLEHFIIKIDDKIVSAALIRIIKIPLIKRGVAYIRYGPLWQKRGETLDINILKLALRLLYSEYVEKRKYILRISSGLVNDKNYNFSEIFKENKFELIKSNHQSIILDTSSSEENIRTNLRKHWRHHLNIVEKKDIKISQNCNQDFFNTFLSLYKNMLNLKKFKEYINVAAFGNINFILPSKYKMQIFICEYKEKPVSGLVISAMGNSCIALLAATNAEGREISSSYLMWWEAIKWLKTVGIKWFDLGGIDPINGTGVYLFKRGLGGKEVEYIGCFEAGKYLFFNRLFRALDIFKTKYLLYRY